MGALTSNGAGPLVLDRFAGVWLGPRPSCQTERKRESWGPMSGSQEALVQSTCSGLPAPVRGRGIFLFPCLGCLLWVVLLVQTKSEVWPRIHWNLFGMGQGLVPTQAIFFIFERETKRQSVSQGGAEREGGTESEAGSRL